jgi:Ulp1 family protease
MVPISTKVTRIRENLWNRQDLSTVLGTLPEANIAITVEHLKRLLVDNWLSDDVINCHLVLVCLDPHKADFIGKAL